MSDHRIGTCTVCRTASPCRTQPAHRPWDAPQPPKAGPSAVLGPAYGRRSVAGELPVRRAVRTRRLRAEPLDLVLLVVGEVALEPEPLGLALVGEDVGGDAVEEP